MASGDRKVRWKSVTFPNPSGGNVIAEIRWVYFVEDKAGVDGEVQSGSISVDLGTPAAFLAMTGAQMRTAVLAKLADVTIPPHDSAN